MLISDVLVCISPVQKQVYGQLYVLVGSVASRVCLETSRMLQNAFGWGKYLQGPSLLECVGSAEHPAGSEAGQEQGGSG